MKKAIWFCLVLVITFLMVDTAFLLIGFLIGANPFKNESYNLSLMADAFSGYKNTPNFTHGNAIDGLDNYSSGHMMKTDENGFISESVIKKEKDSGVVRIFLRGGSVAFGGMQNRQMSGGDSSYPNGVYTYNSSIAGLLKKNLETMFPHRKFEVINAGVVMSSFLQGFEQYMTLTHLFHPDIIINLDGRNDEGNFIEGNMYLGIQQYLEKFISLEAEAQRKRWPWSLHTISYWMSRNTNHSRGVTAEIIGPGWIADDTSMAYYHETIEPKLQDVAHDFLWNVAAYEQRLKMDGVHSIFVLQPMLARINFQKQLSPLEQKLRQSSGLPRSALDGHFYDQYLSPKLDSVVRLNGGDFVDMGKEIMHLKTTDEIFMDDCHLTILGNKICADVMAKKVAQYLEHTK